MHAFCQTEHDIEKDLIHGVAPCRDLQKVWAAVTLLTSYDGHPCRIQVL